MALVRAQLTAALAALLKRGWADAPLAERRAFFDEVDAAAAHGPPAARRAGLEILEVCQSLAGVPAWRAPRTSAFELSHFLICGLNQVCSATSHSPKPVP